MACVDRCVVIIDGTRVGGTAVRRSVLGDVERD